MEVHMPEGWSSAPVRSADLPSPIAIMHMRSTLLAWTLMVVPLRTQAQSWFADDAVWHYMFSNGGTTAMGHVRVDVVNDTIIGSELCKELRMTRVTGNAMAPDQPPQVEALGSHFLKEQDGLVCILDRTTGLFDTLYHMAGVPGDRWGFPMIDPWLEGGPLDTYVVQDTGSIAVDDQALRWLAVELLYTDRYDSSVVFTVVDTVIERMGGTQSFLYPQDRGFAGLDGNIGGPLRCYMDDQLSYRTGNTLWFWYSDACDFLPTALPEEVDDPFHVRTDPSGTAIVVEFLRSQGAESVVDVMDMNGRLIRSARTRDGVLRIDLNDEPPGMYVLRLGGRWGSGHRKWLKH